MINFQGRFCWHELMTRDSQAAQAFYTAVVGWETSEGPFVPGGRYCILNAGGVPAGGLMPLPQEGLSPAWTGYVAVDDVDESAALAQRLGATIHVPGTDIPNVGRFAVLSDPQGASIALFKPLPCPDMKEPVMGPGMVSWNELHTTDWPAAFEFYQKLFGWQKTEAMDMGEMGIYQMFGHPTPSMGAMFNKAPAAPGPLWLFYVEVADLDAATARITAQGGTVFLGPMEVPGGGRIVQARDPQGALFALYGK